MTNCPGRPARRPGRPWRGASVTVSAVSRATAGDRGRHISGRFDDGQGRGCMAADWRRSATGSAPGPHRAVRSPSVPRGRRCRPGTRRCTGHSRRSRWSRTGPTRSRTCASTTADSGRHARVGSCVTCDPSEPEREAAVPRSFALADRPHRDRTPRRRSCRSRSDKRACSSCKRGSAPRPRPAGCSGAAAKPFGQSVRRYGVADRGSHGRDLFGSAVDCAAEAARAQDSDVTAPPGFGEPARTMKPSSSSLRTRSAPAVTSGPVPIDVQKQVDVASAHSTATTRACVAPPDVVGVALRSGAHDPLLDVEGGDLARADADERHRRHRGLDGPRPGRRLRPRQRDPRRVRIALPGRHGHAVVEGSRGVVVGQPVRPGRGVRSPPDGKRVGGRDLVVDDRAVPDGRPHDASGRRRAGRRGVGRVRRAAGRRSAGVRRVRHALPSERVDVARWASWSRRRRRATACRRRRQTSERQGPVGLHGLAKRDPEVEQQHAGALIGDDRRGRDAVEDGPTNQRHRPDRAS